MKPYERKAQYYETDQMGIIHHSNYIKWFEEARVDMLEQLNLGYDKMENMGIISPTLSVSCFYKSPVHFNDVVEIYAKIVSFSGVRLEVEYEVVNKATGEICTFGNSSHAFIGEEGKPLKLSKAFPEVYGILSEHVTDEDK